MSSNRITTSMPILLTVIMVLLMVLRVFIWRIEKSCDKSICGINWIEASNADLVGARKYQSKLIFYYFSEDKSDTSKKMEEGPLLNKDIVGEINKYFLPVKVIISRTQTSDFEADNLFTGLRQKYGVYILPTFVITLSGGREIGALPSSYGMRAKNLLSFIRFSKQQEKYVAGLEYLSNGQYKQAAEAFEAWLEGGDKSNAQVSNQQISNAILYCALAHEMLFEDNCAKNVLVLIKERQVLEKGGWPLPLSQFLLGEIDGQQLLQLCCYDESKESQAYYFIGMLELRRGNLQGAVSNFKQAEKVANVSSEIHSLVAGQLSIIFNNKSREYVNAQ